MKNIPFLATDYLGINDVFLKTYIVNSFEYSIFNGKTFNEDEIDLLIKTDFFLDKTNTWIINCDKIIEENELGLFLSYIDKYIDYFDYMIYSDYSVYFYLSKKKINYSDKLIYNPKTLVNSINETQTIYTKTFISNELHFNQIQNICNNNKNKICLEVFGYHQIFYSRRPLLTLYNDFIEKETLEKNHLYNLKEELRDDYYKIYQSIHGTFIYTPYVYYLLEKLKSLPDCFLLYINSNFLNYEVISKIYKIYYDYLNSDFSILNLNELKEIEKEYNLILSEGFLNLKSILLKDGNNDE